jgi:hypothetical protein
MTNSVQSVWDKVERGLWNQCWPWKGYVSGGYGRLDIDGVEGVRAHRAAYIAANPDCGLSLREDGSREKYVLHRCDNPVCCNPRHLFIGSHDDNMADKKAKGRSKIWRDSTKTPRAKFTADDVFWIRLQKKYGATKKALALLYEVSEATISGALYGRHYNDVAHPGKSAPSIFAPKLSDDDVRVIRQRHASGESPRLLAKEFGVVERSIHRVLKRWSFA